MKNNWEKPYLIGALEDNHGGDSGLAKDLISLAGSAGMDAISVRRWSRNEAFTQEYLKKPYLGVTRSEMYSEIEIDIKALGDLRQLCSSLNISFIGAPYDLVSLGELCDLDADFIQIEHGLLTHNELLSAAAKTGKHIFLVASRCTDDEIQYALNLVDSKNLTLLHSVNSERISVQKSAIGIISYLSQRFDIPVGYYGTDPGIESAIAAYTLGARCIQKPFTTDHRLPGLGHAKSLDRDELRSLRIRMDDIFDSLNFNGPRVPMSFEVDVAGSGRVALVPVRDLMAGEILDQEMLTVKLTDKGISPSQIDKIVGKPLAYDTLAGEPLTFGMLGD